MKCDSREKIGVDIAKKDPNWRRGRGEGKSHHCRRWRGEESPLEKMEMRRGEESLQ